MDYDLFSSINPQPLKRRIFFIQTIETKGFFQFQIIINVLVSSFWFIWIPMLSWLWVYGYYEYFYSYSAGIDISRQDLTSVDVRFWRLK